MTYASALSIVGGVIGSVIPGVGTAVGYGVGAAIGGAIGSQLDIANQHVEGARIDDLKVPRYEYGAPIPRLWGACRIPGIPIWMSDKREIATTSGGKGAEPEVTGYTYEVDILFLVAETTIAAVPRVWRNSELVYSAHVDSDDETLGASASTELWGAMRVHSGDPAQLPDPVYEAAVGVGNAPAYRRRGTVFIEGLQLGTSGQIPVLTFEVLTEGSLETRCVETEPHADVGYSLILDEAPITVEVGNYGARFTTETNPGVARHMLESTRGVEGCYRYFEIRMQDHRSGGTSSAIVPEIVMIRPGTVSGAQFAAGISRAGVVVQADGTTISAFTLPTGASPGSAPRLAVGQGDRTVGIAYDTATGQLWAYDGVHWYGSSTTADPSTFTHGVVTGITPGATDLRIEFVEQGGSFDVEVSLRTAAAGFVYTMPAGFVPWSSDSADVDVVTPGVVYLDDVVSDLNIASGLETSDIDVTDLAAVLVSGVVATQVSNARALLEMLASVYFFDAVESDRIYFRRRGAAAAATIEFDDLALPGDAASDDPLGVSRAGDDRVPAVVTLQYINPDDDYQTGTVDSDRIIADSEETRAFSVPVVLTAAKAKGLADAAVLDAKVASLTFRPALDNTRPELEPTDPINLVDVDGTIYRSRISRETFADGLRELECVLDDASVLTSAGITDESRQPSLTVRKVVATLWELLDIPILRNADDAPGIYVVCKPIGDGKWLGASVLKSDDDSTFEVAGVVPLAGIFGTTSTALGDVATSWKFDEASSVTVNVGDGELSSTTRALVLSSTVNAALIGDEIVQFRDATYVSPGVYTLTGFLRGRRGTEWATGAHDASERFVLLQTAGMLRAATEAGWIAVERYWKAVSQTRSAAAVDSEAITDTGIALKPFAPVDLRATEDGQALTITWKRRTRLATRFCGPLGINVPLGEASEQYDVELRDEYGTLLTTETVDDASWTLTGGTVAAEYDEGVAWPLIYGGALYGIQAEGSGTRYMLRQSAAGVVTATSVPLGDLVEDVAYNSDKAYVVVSTLTPTVPQIVSASTLYRIDLDDITAIDASWSASGVSDIAVAVLHDGTNPWTLGQTTGKLRKHDPSTLAVLTEFLIGVGARSMARSGTTFYVTLGASGVVAYAATGSPGVIWTRSLSGYSNDIVKSGGLLFVDTSAGVVVLNATTGATVATYAGGLMNAFGGSFAIFGSTVAYLLSANTFRFLSNSSGAVDSEIALNASAVYGTVNGNLFGVNSPTGSFTYLKGYEFVLSPSVTGYEVTVYQLSETVGRGYPATLTL